MHRKLLSLLLAALFIAPVYAQAATYQASNAAELQSAIAAASDGDTIQLVGTLTDVGSVSINKDLTITGGTVTGNSSFSVGGNQNVTFSNVIFTNIHNAASNLSAIYAPGLAGSLTVMGCTFADCDWDSIQVTPVSGAEITITGNTFRDDDATVRQQRYVHIQSAANTDFTATVTGNRMYGDLAQEALGAYYPADPKKQQLSGNYIADTMTYPVCILSGDGENIAQIAYPQITADGQVRTDQAVLGKSPFYATAYPTLEAAAAAGETNLVLLEDTALTENIDLPEGSKLDLNGKTLTIAPGVSLPDTVTVEENGGQIKPAPQPAQDPSLWWLLILLPLLILFVFWLERRR